MSPPKLPPEAAPLIDPPPAGHDLRQVWQATTKFGPIPPLRLWRRALEAHSPVGRSPFTLLRRRLVITNLVIVAVVLALLCVVFYTYEAHLTLSQVDQQVVHEATSEAAKGLPQLASPDEDESPYRPGSPNVFSIVVALPHRVLQDDDQVRRVGLPDWGSADPVLEGKQPNRVATVKLNGVNYRLSTVPIHVGTHIVGAVQSGTALSVYQDQLHSLFWVLVLLSLCTLLLTTLLSIWLAERALTPARQAFTRQRQFAAAASHELRTPLAFIRSQAELIAGAPAAQVPTTEIADDAREIVTEVDYLTRMTRDLLLLARDERDARALALKSIDLREMVREAETTVQPLARERGITLDVLNGGKRRAGGERQRGGGPSVWGDADRLRQLILILLDNALRYTPPDGTISVDMHTEHKRRLGMHHGDVAILTVRDTGVGIAPTEVTRIFEPYYRASAPQPQTREQHASGIMEGGTGLGLALAQWIVHAHGGEITVQSTLGVGSSFRITLPSLPHARAPRLPSSGETE